MSGDIHALSGAYVVDAVDDFERAQFERHLASCEDCRVEVASLREGTALLAETVSQPAPSALRDRVLTTIETVRPLPPLLADVQERARAHRRRLPTLIAAAAALVVIGGAGATVWHPWERPTTAPGITASQLESAPDTQVLTQRLAGGGAITVTRSEALNSAYVSTRNMPRLQAGQTYQLWTIHDGRSVPAGLVDGDASKVVVDGNPGSASALAMTIEPAGGVEQPTSEYIVASFDFTEA